MTRRRRIPAGCTCPAGMRRADCKVHRASNMGEIEDEMRAKAEARLEMFPGDDYVGDLIAWSPP